MFNISLKHYSKIIVQEMANRLNIKCLLTAEMWQPLDLVITFCNIRCKSQKLVIKFE